MFEISNVLNEGIVQHVPEWIYEDEQFFNYN